MSQPRSPGRHALPVFLFTVIVTFLLLRLPGNVERFTSEHWLRWPIELPAAVLLLMIAPRRLVRLTCIGIASVVLILSLLRLGDLGARFAFGRAFSPLADLHLFSQGWTLASQSIGRTQAFGITIVALSLLLAVYVLLCLGLNRARHLGPDARRRVGAVSASTLIAGLALGAIQHAGGQDFRVRADISLELAERLDKAARAVRDQRAFAAELAVDPVIVPPRFAALDGRDLLVLFVESYGRSFTDAPLFADRARVSLEALERTAASGGLHVRSGWLDAPIRGGRSWLSHATFASGLALTNQARFDRLLASDRRSLPSLFSDAGWESVTVLPVVSTPWIEGAWYRVDRFIDGPELGYRGQGFGYVTMPDQFTLSAFQRRVREPADGPLAATIGLLGSHAPWAPLALPVPWEAVGDGSIFDGSHRVGRPVNWASPGPVREAYARSVELTLARVSEYLQRYGRDALIIVLGDHQPASVIAGWAQNAHVPIHVFADDERLLERLPADSFTTGALPASDAVPLPMNAMRALLSTRYELPLEPVVTGVPVQP